MGLAVRPVHYRYPLKDFDDSAFAAKCRELLKMAPTIVRHFVRKEIIMSFPRALTDAEKATLDSLYESPPTGYLYELELPEPEEVKEEVEASVGVRPLHVMMDEEGRIRRAIFEAELTPEQEFTLKTRAEKRRMSLRKRKV